MKTNSAKNGIQTLHGPNGLKIELDAAEIYPNDPGMGTPVLVLKGDAAGTFECATSEGELDDCALTEADLNWLESQRARVETWLASMTRWASR